MYFVQGHMFCKHLGHTNLYRCYEFQFQNFLTCCLSCGSWYDAWSDGELIITNLTLVDLIKFFFFFLIVNKVLLPYQMCPLIRWWINHNQSFYLLIKTIKLRTILVERTKRNIKFNKSLYKNLNNLIFGCDTSWETYWLSEIS